MRGKSDTIFQLFPNRYRNKRQASKPSPLRRGEELLRQIGDQATAAAAGPTALDLPRDGARVGSLQGG